jgi:hypothetical protein
VNVRALSQAWRTVRDWAWGPVRDIALNIGGFLLFVAAAGWVAAMVRSGVDGLLGWGPVWPAFVFIVVVAAAWGTLFGLLDRKHLRNPDGKVLPLPALGVLLGGAVMWVYIFAALSYVLELLGALQYAGPGKPEDLLYKLTDAYMWHFLDLLPGLNITGALGWKSPVDLQGGWRGVLLVLFRAAVIYQVLAKGRQLFKRDEPEKS